MSKPKTRPRYSPEVRERAVRMVLEHEGDYSSRWAAIESVAAKIGCVAQTLDQWIKQAERDTGARTGLTTDERAKMKAMEREIKELRQANEILKKASAYFALAELDRRWKP
jgi:transposase